MGFFDFVAKTAKGAMDNMLAQKINDYRRMGSYEIKEYFPNITNRAEKHAAIMALSYGNLSDGIRLAKENDLSKNEFSRYATNQAVGKIARDIVANWDNY